MHVSGCGCKVFNYVDSFDVIEYVMSYTRFRKCQKLCACHPYSQVGISAFRLTHVNIGPYQIVKTCLSPSLIKRATFLCRLPSAGYRWIISRRVTLSRGLLMKRLANFLFWTNIYSENDLIILIPFIFLKFCFPLMYCHL